MKPLVSILIPSYNAEPWIAETIMSALRQTWPRKEIIVVDDGSKDNTAAVADRFSKHGVRVVARANQGAAATRNQAYNLSEGDYIQWLDSDDVLAPDKVEKQLNALTANDGPRVLMSSAWAPFYYRTSVAKFIDTALCADLSPVEWLILKMGSNLHMQTATWLTSRDLAEAAGPWDTRMLSDDDGEYFSRVLLHTERTRFVAGTGAFWRTTTRGRLSYIGGSLPKQRALLLSMQLHVKYILSLEDSERTRQACLRYFQTWYGSFSPEFHQLTSELRSMAAEFGGTLVEPQLRPKFAWMKTLFGAQLASRAQNTLPWLKSSWKGSLDKLLFQLDGGLTLTPPGA